MVTQSLLKADVLSQRFLAVAALALRKKKWGKKEIPSCNGKNFIFFFFLKGSTVENCPTLMRISNVSWRPTKSEEWGKQWEVADSRLYHPALVFDQINWYFWEELHPAVFTTSQLWTGPSSPAFLSCALCWKDGDLPQHLCIFQKLWAAFHALSLPLPLRNHFRLIQPFQKHRGEFLLWDSLLTISFFWSWKTTHRPVPGTALHWQPHTNHKSYCVRLMWAMTQATWFTSTVTIIHFMLIY